MCIVIVKTEKTDIPKEQLKESFDNNRDGSGYLFAMNGNLTIKKGFFVFNDFYDNYSRDMERFNNPVSIIHFRITTHGLTNKLNCHPFLVNDEIGFAHNGMIDFVDNHKKKSDTMMFRNDILRNMPSEWIFNDSVLKLMEESIGNSKLAFLDRNGNYRIVNEGLGHWNKNDTICIPINHIVKLNLLNMLGIGLDMREWFSNPSPNIIRQGLVPQHLNCSIKNRKLQEKSIKLEFSAGNKGFPLKFIRS